MAVRNHTEPIAAARRLQTWLATNVADGSEVMVSDAKLSTVSGMSNETLLFDAKLGGPSRTPRRTNSATGRRDFPAIRPGP